ncbi:MAG: hypothetical protein U1F14_15680 [Steroidobacteraceae bacterium]
MATNDTAYTLADYVSLLKRRRRILLTVFPAAVLISIFYAYWLPTLYESSATILIEASSVSDKMVMTTVAIDSDAQINAVRRGALSNENLRVLVQKLDPYPDSPEMSVDDKISLVRSSVSLLRVSPTDFKPDVNGAAFTISYQNPDRARAKAVMQQLAELFLDYNRKARERAADETYRFLSEKAKAVDAEVRAADQKIADFKRRFGNALPEDRVRNEVAMERARGSLDDLEGRIRDAEQHEQDLELQLSQLNPTLAGAAGDWRTELANAKAQLAAAEQRYTPEHPDVRRLRRAVAELAARGASESGKAVVPDNPEYLRVSTALAAARRDTEALRSLAIRTRGELQSAAGYLSMTPAVEREYTELMRSQSVAREQFAEIQEKLHTAEIGKTFETEVQGERYTLVRSASSPSSPASPNRLGLIMLGFLLGGGLSVGLAALAETSDQTVRSYHDVRQVSRVALLGAVPILLNPVDARRRKILVGTYAGVFGVALLIVGITVARADGNPMAPGPLPAGTTKVSTQ